MPAGAYAACASVTERPRPHKLRNGCAAGDCDDVAEFLSRAGATDASDSEGEDAAGARVTLAQDVHGAGAPASAALRASLCSALHSMRDAAPSAPCCVLHGSPQAWLAARALLYARRHHGLRR